MIYTVTLNPALDIFYTTDKISYSDYTYAKSANKYPGGKPINISRMLNILGIPSLPTGFIGGASGKFITNWFDDKSLSHNFFKIDGENRINVRLKTPTEQITIAGTYPEISKETVNELLIFLSRLREGDILVMGGSIPKGVPDDIYIRLAEICKANKADFVVDVDHLCMKTLLKYKPLLIKPNIDYLAKMFDVEKIETEIDIIKYGKKCIELGAKNVIVSLAEEGSYLFTDKGEAYRSYGVKGVEVNSFNSRDAMIGGFIGIHMRKQDPVESFKMASAAASATAFVEDLAEIDLIKEVYAKTVVEKIEF